MKSHTRIQNLSDSVLQIKLEELRAIEKNTTLEILLYLLEVEDRKLYAELGYSSMFTFCMEHLGYCASGTSRRIRTVRCMRDYPEVYQMLLRSEVTLSSVSEFSSVLTEENSAEVLQAVKGLSRDRVKIYVARYRPAVVRKEWIKPIVEKKKSVVADNTQLRFENAPKEGLENHDPRGCKNEPKQKPESEKEEFETLFDIRFSADQKFMDLFKEAALVLSAKHPCGVSSEVLFREALECFLDKKSPKRREERRLKRSQNRQKQTNSKPSSLNRELKPKFPSRGPRIAGVVLKDKILKRDGLGCFVLAIISF